MRQLRVLRKKPYMPQLTIVGNARCYKTRPVAVCWLWKSFLSRASAVLFAMDILHWDWGSSPVAQTLRVVYHGRPVVLDCQSLIEYTEQQTQRSTSGSAVLDCQSLTDFWEQGEQRSTSGCALPMAMPMAAWETMG